MSALLLSRYVWISKKTKISFKPTSTYLFFYSLHDPTFIFFYCVKQSYLKIWFIMNEIKIEEKKMLHVFLSAYSFCFCIFLLLAENPVALVLSNLWILRMLLMPNIIWMVKFFLVGSSLLFLLKRIERSQLRWGQEREGTRICLYLLFLPLMYLTFD